MIICRVNEQNSCGEKWSLIRLTLPSSGKREMVHLGKLQNNKGATASFYTVSDLSAFSFLFIKWNAAVLVWDHVTEEFAVPFLWETRVAFPVCFGSSSIHMCMSSFSPFSYNSGTSSSLFHPSKYSCSELFRIFFSWQSLICSSCLSV